MKLAVGLPVLAEVRDSGFLESVAEFRGEIGEVYFAWIGEPSGRSVSSGTGGRVDPTAQQCLESDLRALREMGLRLDLLCNANCYGPGAASTRLADHITSLVDHLLGAAGLDTVTTASPFIAAVIKRAFPELETRASVNMRIGTVEGMRYLADVFDSFHLQREYNRDRERIADVAQWCRRNGKTLCLLANSGCLYSCSGQTFHDNLVAHEGEWLGPEGRHPGFAQGLDDVTDVPPGVLVCQRFLDQPENWVSLVQATWVRPEDLHHYEADFAVAKLATRMHQRPGQVIAAYARRSFRGNLLDLLEPGHGRLLRGHVIDNTRFPLDWFDRVCSCGHDCRGCTYCAEILAQVLQRAE